MDSGQILTWLVTGIGILGFFLAGRKIWWCWYVNIGCQVLWFTYAIVTKQYAFVFASIFYTVVFSLNAMEWTQDHFSKKKAEVSG